MSSTETQIIDGLFNDTIIDSLNYLIKDDCFFGWKSQSSSKSKIYHSNYVVDPKEGIEHFYNKSLDGKYQYETLINSDTLIAEVTKYISTNFFNGTALSRVYGNIQHFGQESSIHRDYPKQYFETARTAVLYLNDIDIQAGGDVIIVTEEDEIEKAIRIKKGRLIIFNGCKLHGVRPLSKYFEDSRNALVFGVEVVNK